MFSKLFDMSFISDSYRMLEMLPLPLDGGDLRIFLLLYRFSCNLASLSIWIQGILPHYKIYYKLFSDAAAAFLALFFYYDTLITWVDIFKLKKEDATPKTATHCYLKMRSIYLQEVQSYCSAEFYSCEDLNGNFILTCIKYYKFKQIILINKGLCTLYSRICKSWSAFLSRWVNM